ncbi:hypothetical protein D3C84_1267230 [compost metagenome]
MRFTGEVTIGLIISEVIVSLGGAAADPWLIDSDGTAIWVIDQIPCAIMRAIPMT